MYQCPNCKSEREFSLDISTSILMKGEAIEVPDLKEEIDGNTPITCQTCGFSGLVHEFEKQLKKCRWCGRPI